MVRGIASSRTIYVGNLPSDIREREVEDIFYKYGHVVDIDLKVPPRPPGYAFVEFEDARDAEDAIRGRDGYEFDGHRLRVELAHGGGPRQNEREGSLGYRGSGGGRPGGVSRRTEHRVLVTNLPSSASWQDLKDHMRKAGDVCFAQVFREGGAAMGIVDYTNREDMKNAIRKLDDSEFKNPFHKAYIRVKADKSDRSPSRSRSRSRSPPRRARSVSRSRSRSRTRSPPRSRSVSQSPARSEGSPKKSKSPTPKRSPSRSRSSSPVPVEEKGMDSSPPIVEESVPPAEESVLPAEKSLMPAEESVLPAENSVAPAEASEPVAEESAPPAEESTAHPAEDPMED